MATTTFFNFGNPLLLSSASTSAWSGTNSPNWADSGNFSGSTFVNSTGVSATPVSFGDKAADGVTEAQNTNVTVPAGGVTPFSVTFNNNSLTYSFSGGAIGGTAPVTLNGSGVVNFTVANTYSGATTINSGTLRANNGTTGSATGTSNITVAGGTLGGNGTITGTVDVTASGTITAGADANHIGTLSTSDESWASGGTYSPKVDGTSASADLISIGGGTGSLTLPASGAFNVSVQSDGTALTSTPETWTLATFGTAPNFVGTLPTTQGASVTVNSSQFALSTTRPRRAACGLHARGHGLEQRSLRPGTQLRLQRHPGTRHRDADSRRSGSDAPGPAASPEAGLPRIPKLMPQELRAHAIFSPPRPPLADAFVFPGEGLVYDVRR